MLRGIEELATENISYTAEKTGNVYDFNTAEKQNQLLIKLLLATGQLAEGGEYDVDFDHQFLEAEKYDSKRVHMGTGTMCILIIAELLQFRFSHTHQPLAVIGLFA